MRWDGSLANSEGEESGPTGVSPSAVLGEAQQPLLGGTVPWGTSWRASRMERARRAGVCTLLAAGFRILSAFWEQRSTALEPQRVLSTSRLAKGHQDSPRKIWILPALSTQSACRRVPFGPLNMATPRLCISQAAAGPTPPGGPPCAARGVSSPSRPSARPLLWEGAKCFHAECGS